MLILLINYLGSWGTLLTLLKINFKVNHADHNCYGNCFLQMIFCMNRARVDHTGTTEAMFLCARGGRGFRGFLPSFPSVFILRMKSTEPALQTCSHCKLDTNRRRRSLSLGPLSHLQLYDYHSKDRMLFPLFIFSARLLCILTLHRREVCMATVA